METMKFVAAVAVAAGLFSGATVAGTGVAAAAAGPVPVWGPHDNGPWGHEDDHHWRGDDHDWRNNSWGPRDPVPGGWNGGWEPWGGLCVFGACI